jgi:hypothetical protein
MQRNHPMRMYVPGYWVKSVQMGDFTANQPVSDLPCTAEHQQNHGVIETIIHH